jgi:hypothetical protein
MPLTRLACSLVLALTACCSPRLDGAVEARTLLAGDQSAIETPVIEVLRSAEACRAWWERHSAGGAVASEPKVDWERDMVVAVELGAQPSLGYGIELESARREAGVVRLLFRKREPAPGSLQGQVVTHPFRCVLLPRSEGEVVVEIQ